MSDWPGISGTDMGAVVQTLSLEAAPGQHAANMSSPIAAATWGAANTALYMPVNVHAAVTLYKMSFTIGVQSGNYDIGVYDENGVRLVSKGSTALPVAGIVITDIADTLLTPGVYFFALNIDNTTATVNKITMASVIQKTVGMYQQAVGAVTLPNPATFASPSGTVAPVVTGHLRATV